MRYATRRRHRTFLLATMFLILSTSLSAQTRVRPPDFDVSYELESIATPNPRSHVQEIVDVVALVATLALAAFIALKLRSRTWMVVLTLAALGYFGFYRKGCICSIGAIQNVSLAAADSGYAVPITVVLFFALPLVFALFFGRVFCAAACPLGAIQDVVLLKPLKLPDWLTGALGVIPFLILGLAVMLASTGTSFIICRFDPFVAFFRLSGHAHMLIAGGVVLLVATVIGRPYCRFVCPYGALLGLLSRLSWKHTTITPDDCIVCGLCEDACPFGAILKPTTVQEDSFDRQRNSVRKALVTVLVFVLPVTGGLLGALAGPGLSRSHETVQLAQRIHLENGGQLDEFSFESEAFRGTGSQAQELYEQARRVQHRFVIAGAALGVWVGLVLGVKLFGLNRTPVRREYEINRADCVSCGRCFSACPRERERRKDSRTTPEPKGT